MSSFIASFSRASQRRIHATQDHSGEDGCNGSAPNSQVVSQLTGDGSMSAPRKVEETKLRPNTVQFLAGGQKISKYVRVPHTTSVDSLWTVMSDTWRMGKPHLLISVTGGAQRLSTDSSLMETFRKGLVEAAQSTGAWIITGGTNAGVMQLVGDAIGKHTLKKRNRKPLVAIGIATYGCITNKEALDVAGDALYEVEDPKKGVDEAPLDPNHTHFILVDDGTQYQYGAEIKLRAALEEKISSIEECGVRIPIVCIVFEGGPNTIATAKEAIEVNTPVIIIEGSGRAADVLASAYNHYTDTRNDQTKQQLVEKAMRSFENLDEEKREKVRSNIEYCLDHHNMITVFQLDGKGSAGRIDHAIIMTLLRVKGGKTSTLDKMKLALAWDRIDVVKQHIYKDETKLNADELKELAFTAIVNNRVEFVKFFLERGLRLNELLEKSKINDFYQRTMERNKHLKDSLKDINVLDEKLVTLDQFIKGMVNRLFDPTELRETSTMLPLFTKSAAATDDAAKELFFWAILSRLQSMAVVFLYKAKETFALSLIGQLMLRNLLKKETDSESKQELQSQVDFFEGLTTGILTECYSSDQEMTIDLLVRPIHAFADFTALEMAFRTRNKSVIAHQACQDLLTVIWMGKISDDNPPGLRILLCVPPFFLLAPLFLKYRERTSAVQSETTNDGAVEDKGPEEPKKSPPDKKVSAAVAVAATTVAAPVGMTTDAESRENPCRLYWKRLGYFLTAPCVKFIFNCMSYVAFLLLYSIILLTNFYPTISSAEVVLIVWVVTLICEEIRQIVESREGGRRKFLNYLSNRWNVVDFAAIAAFLIGLILRLIPISSCDKCFYAARIILAFSLMIFYFLILHMFSIIRHLGPTLVMIGEMIIDLIFFMIILVIFIIAYGIAANVILYPNQELKPRLFVDVLSGAWWSVYGEFNIDEVSGESCEPLAYQTSSAQEWASLDYDEFNRTLCPGKDEKCPAINWFGPIFLAIYALFTNVLMINLLIAMFSNTFAKVEGTADVIWKTQRYRLIFDYESRPLLPPPLIVLEHLYRLIQAIVRLLRGLCPRQNDDGIDTDAVEVENARQSTRSRNRKFRMWLVADYDKVLMAWLKANSEEYLLKKESVEAEGDRLTKETTNERDLDKRLKSLEAKMNQIIALLDPKNPNRSQETRNSSSC